MPKVKLNTTTEIDFDAAVALMDDDIREMVHALGAEYVTTEQDFLNEYCLRHFDKYGETFKVN